MLSAAQIDQFVHDGFIQIEGAFPRDLDDECRRIRWLATGCASDDPSTWTRPVVRIGENRVSAVNLEPMRELGFGGRGGGVARGWRKREVHRTVLA